VKNSLHLKQYGESDRHLQRQVPDIVEHIAGVRKPGSVRSHIVDDLSCGVALSRLRR
jgi:hypothetical protein